MIQLEVLVWMIICLSVLDRKATCPRLSPRGGGAGGSRLDERLEMDGMEIRITLR